MQDTERLVRSPVNGHRGNDAIIAEFNDLDAERVVESSAGNAAPPGRVAHGTTRGGRVRMSASISAISRGALLMRSRPLGVMM